jgi:hypothetical protein
MALQGMVPIIYEGTMNRFGQETPDIFHSDLDATITFLEPKKDT